MRYLLQMRRAFYINFIIVKHRLDRALINFPIFYPFRFLFYLNPYNWWRREYVAYGESLRLALETLGPIFVKFGQLLSTRRDLLPAEIIMELAKLQDNVPPFPGEQTRDILEKVYGKPLAEIFNEFDLQPLASASIAQVHAARLPDGKEVVVKVVRPGIDKIIRRDLDLLYSLANLLQRYWAPAKKLRPVAVVAEFEATLLNELDLMREAASASQLRRNFTNSSILYIPQIYWEYCRHKVMVMERIYGTPIADHEALKKQGIDLKKCAENCVEVFFTQVFRDCFFHADMHPGNLFVIPGENDNPRIIAVDFGIMGALSSHDQRYLAANLLAFFKRDYRKVAVLHVESEWVPAQTRVEEFESAIRTVCEPIFDRPLRDISCGEVMLGLFQTARQFEMEIQPQLVLLQKTLLNIEGLGRQLWPDLDLWGTMRPFLERWIKKQIGMRAALQRVRNEAPFWMEHGWELPELAYKFLRKASMPVPVLVKEVRGSKRLLRGVLFALSMIMLIAAGYELNWIHQFAWQSFQATIGFWLSLILGMSLLIYFIE